MNPTVEFHDDAGDKLQKIWLKGDIMVAFGGSQRVVSEIKTGNIL